MESTKTIKERFAEARQLELAGDLPEAAAVYQKMVDSDPGNQAVVARLLVIYRKSKEYGKELAVIDAVLATYAQRDKDLQAKWIKEHPKAAGAGRSILKQLGGAHASAFGVNSVVAGLQKRREIVVRRMGGGVMPKVAKDKREAAATVRRAAAEQRKTAGEQRKAASEQRKAAAQQRKAAGEQRKAAEEERKRAVAERKKAASEAKAAKAARQHPSLFIISLRYLVALEKIDAAMPSHLSFLKKHYDKGDFLVSGRQVPRTGGIIIARGKDRDTVERLMKADPFVKNKLASIDIVEFMASQAAKGWKG